MFYNNTYHRFLNEILQSMQTTRTIAIVLSANGILKALQIVHGLFGIVKKLFGSD